MTDLDLTKPLRFKEDGKLAYPVIGYPNEPGSILVCTHTAGGPISWICSPDELENVPEPSFVRWAVLTLDSEGRLTHYVKPYTLHERARQYNGTLIKLTRTEDGRTHAEVVDG